MHYGQNNRLRADTDIMRLPNESGYLFHVHVLVFSFQVRARKKVINFHWISTD